MGCEPRWDPCIAHRHDPRLDTDIRSKPSDDTRLRPWIQGQLDAF